MTGVQTCALPISVALSAQATDKSVNKATEPLFKTIDTPEKMLALGEAKLTDAIKTIGLYRGKAKNVIALSKILIEKHGSVVPKDRAALEELPGVGRVKGPGAWRGLRFLSSSHSFTKARNEPSRAQRR